jgi:tetraacyldisaccharide 4'-kinase
MAKILYPISLIYSVLSLLDRKLTAGRNLAAPVISVGNITWGGSGKTPIVIDILETLVKNGLKPAVLTRGYGRKSDIPVLAAPSGERKTETIDASLLGDEPALIAKSVPEAAVISGSCRYENALKFIKDFMPDVYVLDDGFQHWKIRRDFDIVCVNAANPFGNGMLIPAGILREKPSALKRAGAAVITNSDMVLPEELEKLKKEIYEISGINAFVTHYGGYEFSALDLHTKFDAELLKNSSVYSLSAIGFAGGFKNSAEKAGVKLSGSFVLKDHKNYSAKEIEIIFKKIGGNAYILTTAKDAVKLCAAVPEGIKKRIAALNVKPEFESGRQLWEKTIKESLRLS